MSDQYYCFYPGDYHRDTGDLTMLEHGAYRTLLDHYYMQGGLDAQAMRLHRLCRAFTEEERQAVDNIVKRFFRSEGGRLYNKKADEEIEKRRIFQEKMSERGKKGADARWKKQSEDDPQGIAQAMPQAMHKQCLADGIPSPSPSLKEKENKKQRANPVPQSVDNPKKEITALFLKAKDHYPSADQLRQIQLFIENHGRGNIKAIMHCLRRLSEEAEKGKPVLIIGKWLEKIMKDEEPIYNARDAEAETAAYKRDFTKIEDIFRGMPR